MMATHTSIFPASPDLELPPGRRVAGPCISHAASTTPRRQGALTMATEKQCERCGEDIPEARLRALPETRLCLTCSREIGGDYVTYVIAENTGKPGSLKKNYGSWSVKRKLRPITPKKAD
jgi:hypothetical protein